MSQQPRVEGYATIYDSETGEVYGRISAERYLAACEIIEAAVRRRKSLEREGQADADSA